MVYYDTSILNLQAAKVQRDQNSALKTPMLLYYHKKHFISKKNSYLSLKLTVFWEIQSSHCGAVEIQVFWDVTPCQLVNSYLHLHGQALQNSSSARHNILEDLNHQQHDCETSRPCAVLLIYQQKFAASQEMLSSSPNFTSDTYHGYTNIRFKLVLHLLISIFPEVHVKKWLWLKQII